MLANFKRMTEAEYETRFESFNKGYLEEVIERGTLCMVEKEDRIECDLEIEAKSLRNALASFFQTLNKYSKEFKAFAKENIDSKPITSKTFLDDNGEFDNWSDSYNDFNYVYGIECIEETTNGNSLFYVWFNWKLDENEQLVVVNDSIVETLPMDAGTQEISQVTSKLFSEGIETASIFKLIDGKRSLQHVYASINGKIRHTYAAEWYA